MSEPGRPINLYSDNFGVDPDDTEFWDIKFENDKHRLAEAEIAEQKGDGKRAQRLRTPPRVS